MFTKSKPKTTTTKTTDYHTPAFVYRMMAIPALNDVMVLTSHLYDNTKESNEMLRAALVAAEDGVRAATMGAIPLAEPLVERAVGGWEALDGMMCRGIDRVQQAAPIITRPTEQIMRDTRVQLLKAVAGTTKTIPNSLSDAITNRATNTYQLSREAGTKFYQEMQRQPTDDEALVIQMSKIVFQLNVQIAQIITQSIQQGGMKSTGPGSTEELRKVLVGAFMSGQKMSTQAWTQMVEAFMSGQKMSTNALSQMSEQISSYMVWAENSIRSAMAAYEEQERRRRARKAQQQPHPVGLPWPERSSNKMSAVY